MFTADVVVTCAVVQEHGGVAGFGGGVGGRSGRVRGLGRACGRTGEG